jgi:hypothetical protein
MGVEEAEELVLPVVARSTLSLSSKRTPSLFIITIHSSLEKHGSDFAHKISSMPLHPAIIISRTMSDHGSMELASLMSACSAKVECIQGGGTFAYALEYGFTYSLEKAGEFLRAPALADKPN